MSKYSDFLAEQLINLEAKAEYKNGDLILKGGPTDCLDIVPP